MSLRHTDLLGPVLSGVGSRGLRRSPRPGTGLTLPGHVVGDLGVILPPPRGPSDSPFLPPLQISPRVRKTQTPPEGDDSTSNSFWSVLGPRDTRHPGVVLPRLVQDGREGVIPVTPVSSRSPGPVRLLESLSSVRSHRGCQGSRGIPCPSPPTDA